MNKPEIVKKIYSISIEVGKPRRQSKYAIKSSIWNFELENTL